MTLSRPPSIDPSASARWAARLPMESPWLHEEVAQRMEERLGWLVLRPQSWVHWGPLRGGVQAHQLLMQRYPKAQCYALEPGGHPTPSARRTLSLPWWQWQRWRRLPVRWSEPDVPVHMVWANMALHMAADPQAMLAHWHRLLAPQGFLMFSCLGPDTVRELRALYADMGWPEPAHAFTDMHDWGDMLLQAGFAEPVMDMERITLTFATPERLLAELRQLGRNLHVQRFTGLRGRAWYAQLLSALDRHLRPAADGALQLTFEVIYGHAFKPEPRTVPAQETTVSLEAVRQSLRQAVHRESP